MKNVTQIVIMDHEAYIYTGHNLHFIIVNHYFQHCFMTFSTVFDKPLLIISLFSHLSQLWNIMRHIKELFDYTVTFHENKY